MADKLLVIGEGVGSKRRSVLRHFGPSSYAQMTTGPVAAGDVVKATQLGLKTIESVEVDAVDDGVKAVVAVLVGLEPTQVTLAWFTSLARTAQINNAVDLSTFSCRITATGL